LCSSGPSLSAALAPLQRSVRVGMLSGWCFFSSGFPQRCPSSAARRVFVLCVFAALQPGVRGARLLFTLSSLIARALDGRSLPSVTVIICRVPARLYLRVEIRSSFWPAGCAHETLLDNRPFSDFEEVSCSFSVFFLQESTRPEKLMLILSVHLFDRRDCEQRRSSLSVTLPPL